MIPQSKRLTDGRLASWTVDGDTLRRVVPWARENPARLESELQELSEHFPTWLVTFGKLLEHGGWPAAELVCCERCGELLVPDAGVRCVACRQLAAPARLLLGHAGRLPALVTGRRFVEDARRRATQVGRQGRGADAARIESYFLQAGDSTFFAPPVWVFCPSGFPDAEPLVMVSPDYFDVLGIPADHVYPGTRWRLCNYAHWHRASVRTVLQQRILPRIYLDLMLADLAAVGALDRVLREMDLTLHAIYNVAGHAESLARLESMWATWTAS